MVPLTKEQADWAVRLFDACETSISKWDRTADLSESKRDAIYENIEFVPAERVHHTIVRKIVEPDVS